MKLILILCLWIGFSITAIVLKAIRITDVDWWVAFLPALSIPMLFFLMWAYVRIENKFHVKRNKKKQTKVIPFRGIKPIWNDDICEHQN